MVKNHQVGVIDWIVELPSQTRWLPHWFVPAIIGYFIPHIVSSIFGQWRAALTDTVSIVIGLAFLLATTAAGVAFKRVLFVTYLIAIALFLYMVQFTVRTERIDTWPVWWATLFVPSAAVLINGILFRKIQFRIGERESAAERYK